MAIVNLNPIPRSASALVDEFAAVKAAQAELAEREKELKERLGKKGRLNEDGNRVIESDEHRLCIVYVAAGSQFDSAKAKALLSPAQLKKCVKPRPASVQYRCNARVAEDA